jgi:hypothetical protein
MSKESMLDRDVLEAMDSEEALDIQTQRQPIRSLEALKRAAASPEFEAHTKKVIEEGLKRWDETLARLDKERRKGLNDLGKISNIPIGTSVAV